MQPLKRKQGPDLRDLQLQLTTGNLIFRIVSHVRILFGPYFNPYDSTVQRRATQFNDVLIDDMHLKCDNFEVFEI